MPGKNKKMLLAMLEMQDTLNKMVDPNWREKNRAWHRAIWVECAEAMDHLQYKWWKNIDAEVDMDAVRMELVDIWHFMLSWGLQNPNLGAYLPVVVDMHLYTDGESDLPYLVESIARNATLFQLRDSAVYFMRALGLSDMSFSDLYTMYAGKYTLNAFRQDNGYKEGTYRKIWADGREDNEHLTAILKAMDPTGEDFLADVYAALSDRYADE